MTQAYVGSHSVQCRSVNTAEPSSQPASSSFDLRGLDPDRAGLDRVELHAFSTIDRTMSRLVEMDHVAGIGHTDVPCCCGGGNGCRQFLDGRDRGQRILLTEDVVNRNRHAWRMRKKIQRGDLGQELALNDVHVAQSPHATDNAVGANQARTAVSRNIALKRLSAFDRAEIHQEAGAALECGQIQVRRPSKLPSSFGVPGRRPARSACSWRNAWAAASLPAVCKSGEMATTDLTRSDSCSTACRTTVAPQEMPNSRRVAASRRATTAGRSADRRPAVAGTRFVRRSVARCRIPAAPSTRRESRSPDSGVAGTSRLHAAAAGPGRPGQSRAEGAQGVRRRDGCAGESR